MARMARPIRERLGNGALSDGLLAASARIAQGERAVARAQAARRAALEREAEAQAEILRIEAQLASGTFEPEGRMPEPDPQPVVRMAAVARGEAEGTEIYDLESFKQHLREQMAQLPGNVFSSKAGPPPIVLGPPEYSSPPPHPAPLSVRRVRPSSARTAPMEWSPTGRLWGPNHPCLAPRGSPRHRIPSRPVSSSERAWKPETPRNSRTRTTYVAHETIDKLLHSW